MRTGASSTRVTRRKAERPQREIDEMDAEVDHAAAARESRIARTTACRARRRCERRGRLRRSSPMLAAAHELANALHRRGDSDTRDQRRAAGRRSAPRRSRAAFRPRVRASGFWQNTARPRSSAVVRPEPRAARSASRSRSRRAVIARAAPRASWQAAAFGAARASRATSARSPMRRRWPRSRLTHLGDRAHPMPADPADPQKTEARSVPDGASRVTVVAAVMRPTSALRNPSGRVAGELQRAVEPVERKSVRVERRRVEQSARDGASRPRAIPVQ